MVYLWQVQNFPSWNFIINGQKGVWSVDSAGKQTAIGLHPLYNKLPLQLRKKQFSPKGMGEEGGEEGHLYVTTPTTISLTFHWERSVECPHLQSWRERDKVVKVHTLIPKNWKPSSFPHSSFHCLQQSRKPITLRVWSSSCVRRDLDCDVSVMWLSSPATEIFTRIT